MLVGAPGDAMSPFEVGMLACFGVSWPCSIIKTLRTREVTGKSWLFMAIVALGYLSGIVHKLAYSLDWAILFYAANLALVLTDLALYFRYVRRPAPVSVVLDPVPDCWPADRTGA
jgi:hypothetical protein